jgi:fibronectin-binding autotransporter adhesin
MKNRPFVLVASIAALVGLLTFSPRASAQQFWDGPHNDNTTIEGGTGIWSTGNPNWANAAGIGGFDYNENTDVIFSGATGIVTLGSNITTNSNAVSFATDGYVINPDGFALTIVDSLTITVDPGLNATINAPIDGFGSIAKAGSGTLILGSSNTYSGETSVNAGTLVAAASSALGTDSVTVSGPSSLLRVNPGVSLTNFIELNNGASLDNFGTIQASAVSEGPEAVVTTTGDATIVNQLGGAITSSDLIAIQAFPVPSPVGTILVLNSGTISGTIGISLTDAGTITNNSTGVITGNSGIAIEASGATVTFSNAGLVNGSVILDDFANTATLFTGSQISGDLDLGSATAATLILDGAGAELLSQAVAGAVTNFSSLVKQGTGTWAITDTLTYGGGTFLNGGILAVNSDLNLGTGALSFNGGTLEALVAGGGIISSKAITLNAGGGTFLADSGTASTLSGPIRGAGAWTKTGPGTLTLTGTNTYSGGTNLNGGILAVNSDLNLGTGALSFNGGTLEALAAGGGITSSKAVNLAAGGGTFLADTGTVSTLSGPISGVGAWTKAGPGTLILTGSNSYAGGTTINAGTLQLGAGGTTGSITGDVINNGILAFNRSDVLTFNGVIGGTGSVQQNGTGTTVLSGNNTYTGVTAISAGTLQLGNGGTTGSIVGDVIDNGILAFNRSDDLTFDGAISGMGSVQQNGTGTLTLSGANTYAGGTAVNAGSLVAAANNTLGTGLITVSGPSSLLRVNPGVSLTNFVQLSGGASLDNFGTIQASAVSEGPEAVVTTIGDATITNQQGGTITSPDLIAIQALPVSEVGTIQVLNSGTVSGTMGISLSDNGTIANNSTGVITGTGGTAIEASGAAVTFANAGLVNGSVILDNLANTATLVAGGRIDGDLNLGSSTETNLILEGAGTQLLSQAVTGTVTNGGSLTKQGSGNWFIDKVLNAPVSTRILSGVLTVNSQLTSPIVTVSNGAELAGFGPIVGTVTNLGIVSPGTSPGTLTIDGDYTQNPSGTLRIEVAGLGEGEHDLLAVTGHASLAGTLQLIRVGDFNLQVGDQVTFLTANDGISGTFDTIENGFATATIVQAEVIILSNSVVIEGTQGSFVDFACTPNTLAVARALDSTIGDSRAFELINSLNNVPLSELCNELERIAPEELAAVFNIGVSLANVQTANLLRRMDDIRAGSTGFSAAGFTINGSAPSSSAGFAGVTGPEGKAAPPVLAPVPENRWGVFVTGLGEFTNIDGNANALGFDLRTGGVTLGVDYRISPNFAIGLTAGYAHTDVDLGNNGDVDADGGKFGLYATAFTGGFYLDAAVVGGRNWYDTHRSAFLGDARGSTEGSEVNVLAAAGYDWQMGGFSIGPTASFQYTYVDLDGFTESGSAAPLDVDDQNAESIRTAFGVKASYDWKVGRVLVRPEIRLAWQHEYGDTDYSVVSSLASGAGNSFTVNGPEIGRDSLLIGAGAAVLWSERLSTYIYYDGEVGRTDYESHNVSAGVRFTF